MAALALSILDSAGLRHGFFTREGGVSGGLYASLNCGLGSNDVRAHVTANRKTALDEMGLDAGALCTVHQRHTAEVAVVDDAWTAESHPVADAMVTALPGRALGILTADCAPVLLVDSGARIAGAAHAGWRGALAGVLDNTVAAMVKLGAKAGRIRAAVGPCIGPRSYQVGAEFVAAFAADDPENAALFTPPDAEGKRHFDLARYAVKRLKHAGVGAVEAIPFDTCADETRFFSFRRATLRGERDYGRMLSAIALEPR